MPQQGGLCGFERQHLPARKSESRDSGVDNVDPPHVLFIGDSADDETLVFVRRSAEVFLVIRFTELEGPGRRLRVDGGRVVRRKPEVQRVKRIDWGCGVVRLTWLLHVRLIRSMWANFARVGLDVFPFIGICLTLNFYILY